MELGTLIDLEKKILDLQSKVTLLTKFLSINGGQAVFRGQLVSERGGKIRIVGETNPTAVAADFASIDDALVFENYKRLSSGDYVREYFRLGGKAYDFLEIYEQLLNDDNTRDLTLDRYQVDVDGAINNKSRIITFTKNGPKVPAILLKNNLSDPTLSANDRVITVVNNTLKYWNGSAWKTITLA